MKIPKIDIKNIDKRFIKLGLITLGVIVFIIIGLILARIFITSKLSFKELESKMRDEAISYYKNHPELLPKTDEGEVTLDIQKLIDDEQMKPFEKYLKDDTLTCSGKVIVTVNDDNYLYTPYLNCGKKYKTTTLTEVIIDKDNIVESKDGLYNIGDYYIYRGENVNNYVEFAGSLWRILRVNNDGTIRIIDSGVTSIEKKDNFLFDDRYNSEKNMYIGFNNFEVSRMKDTLESVYNGDKFSKTDKSFIVSRNLCIGARTRDNTDKSDNVECATQTTDKYPIGLIQVNEYSLASLDQNCTTAYSRECTNYNYLSTMTNDFWTLTPFNDIYSKTYQLYAIYRSVYFDNANRTKALKIVTTLSSNTLYESGKGTEESPYKIKYNKTKK